MSSLVQGLTFNDVLLIPQYSRIKSRSEVDLSSRITPKLSLNFPVIATNMDTVVGVKMAVAMSKLGSTTFFPRFDTIENQIKDLQEIKTQNAFTIPSVGIKDGEYDRVRSFYDLGFRVLLVDVAHAHQQTCIDFVKRLKKDFKDLELIVGAVATYQGAKDLYEAGADTVKVGVGPGSACTTRIMTGSGMPQLTAIMECARAAKEFHRILIADGGLKNSGDVVKALAAGADAVMSGNLFAGCIETPGEIITIDGKKFKSYNGSASAEEKLRQFKKNSSDKNADYTKYVEGISRKVPLRGLVAEIIDQLDKGIRSGLTYSGALNIRELHKFAKFIQVTPSVIFENHNRELTLN